ncbi:hypothetical protein GCM10023310_31710 [Paenibacillus vulneris]|uniref:MarR family transcriptional regulator n=1 Tax=Paenibacillus vulneris TaxID=1133364 RepID=A0ABW3USL0_9BACL|nr:hypothetical protein [Paenibacillus sp. OAS669]MBE1445752.1 hypothetical protein [Paenibacillus sp. OAS669]
MSLTPLQQSILLTLTTEWQTPAQIAGQLTEAADLSDVNHSLKDLIREGLVQANPVVLGLYRLSTLGTQKTKDMGENQ